MLNILLKDYTSGRLLGVRDTALSIRDEIETALDDEMSVTIDFRATNPTQSFVDELIGTLVTERGQTVLEKLILKNCSPEIKAILNFVVSDRIDDHRSNHAACA